MIDAALAKSIFPDELYRLPFRVMVLLPQSWESTSDADKALLARILGSVKLSLAAVQVMSAENFSLEVAGVHHVKTILSFGVPFLPATEPTYEPVTVDGITAVLADAVHELDEVRKKNLWAALKLVFAL